MKIIVDFVPSCKLGEKLGFEVTSETKVNFAEIKNKPAK